MMPSHSGNRRRWTGTASYLICDHSRGSGGVRNEKNKGEQPLSRSVDGLHAPASRRRLILSTPDNHPKKAGIEHNPRLFQTRVSSASGAGCSCDVALIRKNSNALISTIVARRIMGVL